MGQGDLRNAKATGFPYIVSKNVVIISNRDIFELTVKFKFCKRVRRKAKLHEIREVLHESKCSRIMSTQLVLS